MEGATSNARLWAVETLVSALEDSPSFDKAYDVLADEESKATFDWCIKFRVALSLLGNTAKKLFPPPVEEKAYFKTLEEIKKNSKGNWYKIGGFNIKSSPDCLFGSFIAEQYRLP